MRKQNNNSKIPGNFEGLVVWLTRQPGNNTQLANMIKQLQGTVINLPLFAVESLLTDKLHTKINKELSLASLCICVSRNAAELTADRLSNFNGKIATMGPATAEYIQSLGISEVIFPQGSPFDSKHLLQTLQNKHIKLLNEYIIILTGLDGDNWLGQSLNKVGANVTVLPVYKRVLPNIYDQFIKIFNEKYKVDIIVITCTTSLANLIELAQRANFFVYDTPLLVVSKRIGDYAVERGFNTVYIADSMQDEDILKALQRYRYLNAKNY